VDIADILTEFGAYYIKNADNMKRMVKQLHSAAPTQTLLTPFKTDDTIYRASESRMGRILQPFQKAFTNINSLEFVPVAIEQFKLKADVEESPDDLEGSWLGFLSGEGIDRAEWPFVRWFIEEHLIPQIKEDEELNEIYHGVYAAPVAGVAGAAGTALNGLKKQITDNITAGRITPIVLGAPDADDAVWVDQIEDFADGITQKYQNVPMMLAMNPTLVRRAQRGYRKKYGANANFQDTNGKVDFTNLTIVGLPSMTGSNRIWCTPKENALVLGKKTVNMGNFRVESYRRLLSFFTDYWKGVGFLIPEIVFVNDQA
jgi:hypothetical protein